MIAGMDAPAIVIAGFPLPEEATRNRGKPVGNGYGCIRIRFPRVRVHGFFLNYALEANNITV